MPVYNSSYTGAQHDTYVTKQQLVNLIYPVGAVYISVNSTSPATLFGGTWTQIKDRFILCCGDRYANGATGGEATHTLTLSEAPAHTHTRGTMNITGGFAPWSEGTGYDNAQEQGAFYSVASNQYGWGTATGRDADNEYIYFDASRSWTGETSSVGGGAAHNNMPPYLACYVWQRTA